MVVALSPIVFSFLAPSLGVKCHFEAWILFQVSAEGFELCQVGPEEKHFQRPAGFLSLLQMEDLVTTKLKPLRSWVTDDQSRMPSHTVQNQEVQL